MSNEKRRRLRVRRRIASVVAMLMLAGGLGFVAASPSSAATGGGCGSDVVHTGNVRDRSGRIVIPGFSLRMWACIGAGGDQVLPDLYMSGHIPACKSVRYRVEWQSLNAQRRGVGAVSNILFGSRNCKHDRTDLPNVTNRGQLRQYRNCVTVNLRNANLGTLNACSPWVKMP